MKEVGSGQLAVGSEELPSNWSKITLEEIVKELESGSRPKGGVKGIASGIPSIGGEHLSSNGGFNFANIRYVPEDYYRKMSRASIYRDDILIVKDGATTGKVSFVDDTFPFEKSAVNEHVFILRVFNPIFSKFVFYFLYSQDGNKEILNNFQGSAQGGINRQFISNTFLPISPLNEQKRIVAKLDAIMPRIEAVKVRLDKVPGILKRFRQSVLTAAVTGRLTEQWREEHPEVESANASLSRVSEKLYENYLNVFEDTQYYILPEKWVYAPLERLGEISGGGTPSKSKSEYWKGEIPWISPKDMKIQEIQHGTDFITQNAVNESSVKMIPAGSILFVVRGMILAHTFPVALTLNEVTINQDMKGISPIKEVHPKYFLLVFQNIQNRVLGYIKEATHGTLRLEMSIIQTFAIPLPPLEEQKEIVRQVDILFAMAGKVKAHYQNAKTRVDKLSQSVLAKAFRGELVPQDPNDEPAEKLLERILEEKSRMEAELKSTKKKGKKK